VTSSGRVQGRRRAAGHRGDRRGPAQGARGQDKDHLHVALPQRRHVLAHEGLAFLQIAGHRPCCGPHRRGLHRLTSVVYFVCLCELCRISLAFSPEYLATKPSGECSLHSSLPHKFFFPLLVTQFQQRSLTKYAVSLCFPPSTLSKLGPCLVHHKIQKVFKISYHIESYGTSIKH